MKHLDKGHHFFWSFGLAVLASFFVGPGWGVAIAGLLGLAKEVWDGTKGRWCWWDLAANGVGLIVAWVVVLS